MGEASNAPRAGQGRVVLVAGASGALGREVVNALGARGWRVRALTRNPARLAPLGEAIAETHTGDAMDAASLRGACDGVYGVVSCVGASVTPALGGWRSFGSVDTPANVNLIEEAERASVERFVYVSCHHDADMRSLDYVDAHERVVDRLRASSIGWAVVRPTGFFSALGALVDMAKRGPIVSFGPGEARSNPIHDADLAEVIAEALSSDEREIDAGGPDVLTRREIAELAFRAVGRKPSIWSAPAGLMRTMAFLMRPFHPRNAHLIAFFTEIYGRDLVAPARGKRRLEDHFAKLGRAS